MADEPTIAKLFSEAAARLRADFEYIRNTNPHAAEKGAEIEEVLKEFLNRHLPQRFRAGAGKILDVSNDLSLQQDVIVYDALWSPLYRYAERMQIVPMDAVAAVIEVKSSLGKTELEDAYRKIASVKKLQKRQPTTEERKAAGAHSETTIGVVFGFSCSTSLKALAMNVEEFNQQYDSPLWPDAVVVLDEGVIAYAIQYPGAKSFAGMLMAIPKPGMKGGSPPWFVNIVMHRDREFTLNRFFLQLVAHLQFYPRHYGTPPFEKMLEGAAKEVMTVQGYQFNLAQRLVQAPPELHMTATNNPVVSLSFDVLVKGVGKQIGVVQYLPWQDGAVVRSFGASVLPQILGLLQLREKPMLVADPSQEGMEISSVMPINESDFKRLARLVSKHTQFEARLSTK